MIEQAVPTLVGAVFWKSCCGSGNLCWGAEAWGKQVEETHVPGTQDPPLRAIYGH